MLFQLRSSQDLTATTVAADEPGFSLQGFPRQRWQGYPFLRTLEEPALFPPAAASQAVQPHQSMLCRAKATSAPVHLCLVYRGLFYESAQLQDKPTATDSQILHLRAIQSISKDHNLGSSRSQISPSLIKANGSFADWAPRKKQCPTDVPSCSFTLRRDAAIFKLQSHIARLAIGRAVNRFKREARGPAAAGERRVRLLSIIQPHLQPCETTGARGEPHTNSSHLPQGPACAAGGPRSLAGTCKNPSAEARHHFWMAPKQG